MISVPLDRLMSELRKYSTEGRILSSVSQASNINNDDDANNTRNDDSYL